MKSAQPWKKRYRVQIQVAALLFGALAPFVLFSALPGGSGRPRRLRVDHSWDAPHRLGGVRPDDRHARVRRSTCYDLRERSSLRGGASRAAP